MKSAPQTGEWLAIGGICSFSVGSRRFARTNAALAALSPPTMFLSGAVPPAGATPKKQVAAKLQVLSGQFAGRELELNKALTTLGRPGVQVAAITRRAEGYYIVHVESANDDYPLVNGQSIGPQARALSDNDVITLAGVKMGFFVT